MTMLSMSMHPSDETLSRLADQSELERIRSRAGRHVARCERCRAEIAELHALGKAARGMPDPALPATMQARIVERRRHEGPIAPSLAGAALVAEGSDHPPRRQWSTKKRSAIAVAAAAVVLTALVAPAWRRHVLAAAAPGQATMYPRYPRPGATVGLRFVPAPDWVGGDTLWVRGLIDLRESPAGRRRVTMVTAAAFMLRERDGAYRGRLELPQDALSGSIAIMSISGNKVLPKQVARLVLLTGDSTATRPSIEAMESAVYNVRSSTRDRTLADAFARWAPGHPMRWLLDGPGTRHGVLDWVRYFDSEERRFSRLTEQLNGRRDVRPAELAGMASLAYRIEEPGIAAQWTERLLREHPGDPWALSLRVTEIHQMELRSAPTDSILALVPLLDSLYPTSRLGDQLVNEILPITDRYADPAMQRRWALRSARAGRYVPTILMRGRQLFGDPELRDSVEAFARDVLANHDMREHEAWEEWYSSLNRPRAYASLASVELARGHYVHAVALTDSARTSPCVWTGQDTRALALLALGDTAAALPALATYGRFGGFTPDSARHLLGSYFNPARWQQAVDSVDAVRLSCRRQGS